MKNALWFSRHNPTTEQLADAKRLGWSIVFIEQGKALGSIEISGREDVSRIVGELREAAKLIGATAIFGVWPVDFQHFFCRNRDFRAMECWAAGNLRRSVEGQAPTFVHREWLPVGFLGIRG